MTGDITQTITSKYNKPKANISTVVNIKLEC
jgi:hypothetical protein